MNRKFAALLPLALASGLLLTGCEGSDPPCETLKAPSSAAVQATVEGNEVEREVAGNFGDAECVVIVTGPGKGVWEDQTDDA